MTQRRKRRDVGIGLVGMGFMGLTHLRAARQLKGAGLVAIATSDPRKARGDFSKVGGNFGDAGARENLDGLEIYPTLEALLADDAVDLVDLCLPSFLHAAAAVKVLKAGKSVLVEKPVALKPGDARRMLASRDKTGGLLMVAQVLKFMPEFALLREAVEKERWGRLQALHLRRIIALPSWGDFADPAKSGGMVIDLHIHDTDFMVHLFGKPKSVTSSGVVEGKQVNFLRTRYDYGRGAPLLSSEGGWINAPALAFEHGYDAFFDKATLHYNSSYCPAPRLYTKTQTRDLEVKPVDAFAREIQAAADSVRRSEVHPLLSPDSAAIALAVCLAEQKSARSGQKVEVKS